MGVLYLENNLAPRVFTSSRFALLELLASQAAISLDNARLYSDLQRSEAYLAQGERIGHTGSWGCMWLRGWSTGRRNFFGSLTTIRKPPNPPIRCSWKGFIPRIVSRSKRSTIGQFGTRAILNTIIES